MGGLGPGHRQPFKLENLIKMENELDQDLLPAKHHCKFREGMVIHGEVAYSDPRPAFADRLVLPAC